MTNAVLEIRRHNPSIALRSAIQEWLARHSGHGAASQMGWPADLERFRGHPYYFSICK
jgi:hypothetical protein